MLAPLVIQTAANGANLLVSTIIGDAKRRALITSIALPAAFAVQAATRHTFASATSVVLRWTKRQAQRAGRKVRSIFLRSRDTSVAPGNPANLRSHVPEICAWLQSRLFWLC